MAVALLVARVVEAVGVSTVAKLMVPAEMLILDWALFPCAKAIAELEFSAIFELVVLPVVLIEKPGTVVPSLPILAVMGLVASAPAPPIPLLDCALAMAVMALNIAAPCTEIALLPVLPVLLALIELPLKITLAFCRMFTAVLTCAPKLAVLKLAPIFDWLLDTAKSAAKVVVLVGTLDAGLSNTMVLFAVGGVVAVPMVNPVPLILILFADVFPEELALIELSFKLREPWKVVFLPVPELVKSELILAPLTKADWVGGVVAPVLVVSRFTCKLETAKELIPVPPVLFKLLLASLI